MADIIDFGDKRDKARTKRMIQGLHAMVEKWPEDVQIAFYEAFLKASDDIEANRELKVYIDEAFTEQPASAHTATQESASDGNTSITEKALTTNELHTDQAGGSHGRVAGTRDERKDDNTDDGDDERPLGDVKKE